MKKIILLLALCAGIMSAQADNTITVSPVTIPEGHTGMINLELNNEVEFTAFTMKLTLPAGLSFVLDGEGNPTFSLGSRFTNHGISTSVSGQVATLGCLSGTSAPIAGTSGLLLSVYVLPDETLSQGDVLQATLTEVTFTTPGEVEYNLPNVNISITIGDSRVTLDENQTIMPVSVGETVNVRVNRTIKAGNWSTIVLPFRMTEAQLTTAFGEYQLASWNAWECEVEDEANDNYTPTNITFDFIQAKLTGRNPKYIPAGIYLIKVASDISSFQADDVTISAVNDIEKKDDTGYDFNGLLKGTLTKATIPANGLFLNSNTFYYSDGTVGVKGLRAWLELDAVLGVNPDSNVKFQIFVDGEETAVEEIDKDSWTIDSVYDLGGRKVKKPQQRGLYIINGKKVVVK